MKTIFAIVAVAIMNVLAFASAEPILGALEGVAAPVTGLVGGLTSGLGK